LKLEEFKNRHAGESVVVCGLGESVTALGTQPRFTTIGVNDIGRLFHPTYLLNVNNRSQYKGDRFQYIENSQAKCLFTHLPGEQGKAKIPIVKIGVTREVGSVEIIDGKLPHFRNSPYMAVALAGYMGARRIGLIGVDFTDNHFWIKDGTHRLVNELDRIDEKYGLLAAHLKTQGAEVFNLSPISRLTTLPKMTLEQWNAESA